MGANVTYRTYTKDFNVNLCNIKKLVIYNNPSNPVTIIHENTSVFDIVNKLEISCFNECFNYNFEATKVESVTLEIWK
jgi:hypothetical protein